MTVSPTYGPNPYDTKVLMRIYSRMRDAIDERDPDTAATLWTTVHREGTSLRFGRHPANPERVAVTVLAGQTEVAVIDLTDVVALDEVL